MSLIHTRFILELCRRTFSSKLSTLNHYLLYFPISKRLHQLGIIFFYRPSSVLCLIDFSQKIL